MPAVQRHAIDRTRALKQIEFGREMLDASFGGLRSGRTTTLTSLLQDGLLWACNHSVAEPGSPEIRRGLRLVAAAGAGLARAMASTSGTFELSLGEGEPVTLPATGPVGGTAVGNWITGYFAATTIGEHEALDQICALPISELRKAPTNAQEALWLLAESLRALRVAPNELGALLKQALEATDPSRITFAADYVLEIVTPVLELLYRFGRGDTAGFNETLVFALERHKAYWTTGKRKVEAKGFLALGPSALARLARDAGMVVDVESAYLVP